jgi:hypothetical protein
LPFYEKRSVKAETKGDPKRCRPHGSKNAWFHDRHDEADAGDGNHGSEQGRTCQRICITTRFCSAAKGKRNRRRRDECPAERADD